MLKKWGEIPKVLAYIKVRNVHLLFESGQGIELGKKYGAK